MSDKSKRIEAIMNRTRSLFITDSLDKMQQMEQRFIDWRQGKVTLEQFIETVHWHVHGMKGLAMTLSYHQMHGVCEHILSTISQQEGQVWTIPDGDKLHELVQQLKISMEQELS